MSVPAESTSTRYAADVSAKVPPRSAVQGIVELVPRDRAVWELAAGYLNVRDNDVHTLYAYGLAAALQALLPGSREEIVLPAILLHDTGWSTVPDAQILEAIAPGGGRPDLVRRHEIEGARIARELLGRLDFPSADIEEIAGIIDGHDSRPESLSLNDAIVKDADKLWRLTPHGQTTVRGWFELDADQALRICCARVHGSVFTEPARAMARGLAAIASINLAPERTALT
ncbi:HD domain-containing protein [Arthrobacter sp. I2-34]|uniref:HD domain-containing protein n=1 Tax=Arthrobacter hankyongi TaxID=2904801 RepID=A0ABS9L374_9MICC|nr:HD domain-containing protein [Arthrobacter hankyongi]MCG2621139.1 HD domain-containing protein [Arthrobacter hankyongi]